MSSKKESKKKTIIKSKHVTKTSKKKFRKNKSAKIAKKKLERKIKTKSKKETKSKPYYKKLIITDKFSKIDETQLQNHYKDFEMKIKEKRPGYYEGETDYILEFKNRDEIEQAKALPKIDGTTVKIKNLKKKRKYIDEEITYELVIASNDPLISKDQIQIHYNYNDEIKPVLLWKNGIHAKYHVKFNSKLDLTKAISLFHKNTLKGTVLSEVIEYKSIHELVVSKKGDLTEQQVRSHYQNLKYNIKSMYDPSDDENKFVLEFSKKADLDKALELDKIEGTKVIKWGRNRPRTLNQEEIKNLTNEVKKSDRERKLLSEKKKGSTPSGNIQLMNKEQKKRKKNKQKTEVTKGTIKKNELKRRKSKQSKRTEKTKGKEFTKKSKKKELTKKTKKTEKKK
eukprot:NODE_3245_length_1389_cov_22.799368_g2821_i0.p1 GENE.NODE_3245_length_1389_cov_22.799368_g2821_i0~~NODE_3245_length_1389_cov_22.799368_g2821_i0.p1  ORF type:complete len:416 (-),score=78.74 NODE_3245_length_1389_cov_22.799368_g2821_i0:141-1328(-)